MRKESEAMIPNGKSKFPYFLVAIGLGAVAGLLLAPRAGGETWKYLRERGTRGLDTLNQQAAKLRETAEALVQKGKEIMSRRCCDSVVSDTEAEKQSYEEERRENLGG